MATSPPRFSALRRRAASTSTCRMARAAMRLKCSREAGAMDSDAASLSHASWTSAVGVSVALGSPCLMIEASRLSSSYVAAKSLSSAPRSPANGPISASSNTLGAFDDIWIRSRRLLRLPEAVVETAPLWRRIAYHPDSGEGNPTEWPRARFQRTVHSVRKRRIQAPLSDGLGHRFRGRKVTKLLLDAHLATTIEAVRPIHGLPDAEIQG